MNMSSAAQKKESWGKLVGKSCVCERWYGAPAAKIILIS